MSQKQQIGRQMKSYPSQTEVDCKASAEVSFEAWEGTPWVYSRHGWIGPDTDRFEDNCWGMKTHINATFFSDTFDSIE